MNSERQKREEEIERLMRGAGPSRESDIAFQEEVRRAASAIIEEDATRIEKSEPAERGKRAISPATAGLWLLVLGAGLAFSIPILGAMLIVGGIAGMVWAAFLKSSKKKPSRESIRT
jgi:hypothetical protein